MPNRPAVITAKEVERILTGASHAGKTGRRVRPSAKALTVTLEAMMAVGIPVGKVCITGSKIDVFPASVDQEDIPEKNSGLESWD